jgi:peptide chain release factor 2
LNAAFCTCGTLFDYDGKQAEAGKIELRMAESDFWNHPEKTQEVVGRLKGLKAVLRPLEEAVRAGADLAALVELAEEDESLAAEVPGELDRL